MGWNQMSEESPSYLSRQELGEVLNCLSCFSSLCCEQDEEDLGAEGWVGGREAPN